MSGKPEDIPQDVWDAAVEVLSAINGPPVDLEGHEDAFRIARAILAAEKRGEERERDRWRSVIASGLIGASIRKGTQP